MTASDPPVAQDNNINDSRHISLALPVNKKAVLKYYYDLGFSIIPVDDKKEAIIQWKEFQDKRPSWEKIQEWEEKLNHPNWAVICGGVSRGLVILDFEDKKDAITFFGNDKFEKLKETTLVIETPHNGVHIPLIVKGRIPRRQTKIFGKAHEMDLLGTGGYAMIPGSVIDHSKCKPEKPCDHKSIGEYRIISTSTDIMEAQDIEALIRKRAQELNWEVKLTENENKTDISTDDQEIERIIETLKSKEKFSKVFEGNFKEYDYPSRSEAEQYLLVKLMSLGFSDEVINKIMLKSKTGKWAEESEAYRKLSLNNARTYYINSKLVRQDPQEEKTPEKMETEQKEATEKRTEWFDKNGNIQRDIIINDIFRNFPGVISDEDTVYIWDGDRYSNQGREIIAKYIQNALPEISSRTVSDIVNSIAHITFLTREEFERMMLPDNFIPVRNGLLDWRTKTMKPHDPNYFYSKRLNVDYNPDARCPGFIKYLLSRFEGDYKEFFKVLEDLALILFRDNRYQIHSLWMGQSKDPSGLISGEEGKTLTAEVIIGEKFLGPELYSRASLQSLAEKDTEFEALKEKLLHVASLDEAGHIPNYSGLLEQLRDPYIEKPIKFKRGQLRWRNTTYNILTGNKFPKATANTKAFYRSIRKIVYWRKPMGDDWKYKDQIDEKEKSGILNLAVDIMNIIIARGKPYGLSNLEETISRYREISDSLLMLVQQIFEKDSEAKIEQNEALEYLIEEGEARELVMETLTKNRLTALLKEKFGVIIERTTENKQVKNNDGSETKTKFHRDFYKGIRKKDPKSIITDPEDSTQKQLLDTLEEALLDYVSDIPKSENIQISKIVLPTLYIYNVKQGIQDLDIWISEFKTCLENPNNSISDCVSKSLETIKKMVPLNNQNPSESFNEKPEMTEQFNKILNEIKSKDITINEPLSEIDLEGKRFLVRTLEPYRPDDAMRELGFSFVNQSKDGVLYEKPFNIQALQGGN